MQTLHTKAYGAKNSVFDSLKRLDVEREPPKADELLIDVLYCGVCHSDLHQVKNDWKNTIYPCVPGHEIIGRVKVAGAGVTKYKVGDIVGVGCMIDSCGVCNPCRHDEENYCQGPGSFLATYNGYMKPEPGTKVNTFGGYSEAVVVKESFVLRIPEGLDIKAAAPILCAGVTTYSPLKHWDIKPGDKVGIAGLGGLGHMAVKLASAMGADVTVFTTDAGKKPDAARYGARQTVVSSDKEAMKALEASLDFLLITIPDSFDLTPYVALMNHDGKIVTVGLIGEYKKPLSNADLASGRISVAGSLIGGIAETQEVLDFCAEHGILPETELISIQDINDAYEKMADKSISHRFVIDMQSLRDEA